MTHEPDQSSNTSISARKSINSLTKYLNLASAGLSELNTKRPMPTKAPPPEIIVKDGGFAIRIDEDVSKFTDPSALAKQLNAIPEKRIDLVFDGRSALDLSFLVPNGPFHDLEAMIDTELAFRSPFQREQCVWFWTAKETEALDWQVEAAIVLNTSIDWVLVAMQSGGKSINLARRDRPDGTTRIAVYPSWLLPPRKAKGKMTLGQSLRMIPSNLRLPIATFAFLLGSAVALTVVQSVRQNALSTEAAAANAEISQRVAIEAKTRALKDLRSGSEVRLATVGRLANLLPDDVWLEQISIDDERLSITGYGPSAADVTRLLATVEALSDIQYGSPVTRDNTQNIERFRIDAALTGQLR
jgi:hypothetical protein